MSKTKFKVGDKVRILPSADDVNVPPDEIGKTGVITDYYSSNDILVYMDKPRASGLRVDWVVHSSQIELAVVPGKQLLLWDDIWEKQ